MHTRYTENYVKLVMYWYGIGVVKRVDFVPITGEEYIQSAFIHMEMMYFNEVTKELIKRLYVENKSFKMLIDNQTKWVLLKNKNPIADTKLNIHQIVENARILEQRVEEQNETIKTILEYLAKDVKIEETPKIETHRRLGRLLDDLYS